MGGAGERVWKCGILRNRGRLLRHWLSRWHTCLMAEHIWSRGKSGNITWGRLLAGIGVDFSGLGAHPISRRSYLNSIASAQARKTQIQQQCRLARNARKTGTSTHHARYSSTHLMSFVFPCLTPYIHPSTALMPARHSTPLDSQRACPQTLISKHIYPSQSISLGSLPPFPILSLPPNPPTSPYTESGCSSIRTRRTRCTWSCPLRRRL